MAEDVLGTAIIELRASFEKLSNDLDKARSDADAALKGIEGTASLGVDTSEVDAGAAAAETELEGIEGEAGLGLDASELESGVAGADASLDGVEGTASLGLDWSEFEGAVSAADAMLDGIEATATLGLDTSELDGAVAGAQSQLDGLSGSAMAPGAAMGESFESGGIAAAGGIAGVKGGLGGLAGAAAGFVGIKTFGGFIADAREAKEVSALLGSQLEVTGADAWTSVASIEALAGSIQGTTGISDELVASSAAWLTSFKNVRNETGSMNNVFDRAILVAGDLGAIMGTDMTGATTQLGKALNDPIKGINALARAGVQFTAEQKAMIEGMVASGDMLGAQKIILGEVEGQVGGAAAAMADSTDLLGAKASDLSEAFGMSLTPAVDAFAAVAMPVLDIFIAMPAPLQLVVLGALALVAGFTILGAISGPLGAGLALVGIGGGTAATGLAAGGTAGAASSVGFFAAAAGLWAIIAPILPIIAAFALLVGAIYLIVTHWDTLKAAAAATWDFIGEKVEAVVGWLGDQWEKMRLAAGMAWDWIADKVGGFVDWITGVPDRIGAVFGGMWDSVIGGAKGAFNFVAQSWNRTVGAFGFTVPGWVPVMGGRRFDMPDMPQLASGGSITRSGFALVGERGPEVRWLNKGEAISPIGDGGPVGGGAGGPRPIQIIVEGSMLGSERDFAYRLRDYLDDL